MEQQLGSFWAHALIFISGGTAGVSLFALLAHAVNTFPTPKNVYGQWLLGTIQFWVGQRQAAANSKAGLQTEVTAVTDLQKEQLANGATMQVIKNGDVLKPLG